MFQVCLPVSHLMDRDSPRVRALFDLADVIEYRSAHRPDFVPDKPCVFHWGLGSVLDGFGPEFQGQGLGGFLARIRADWFSFDLGPACRRNDYILPLSPTLGPEDILAETDRSLDLVRRSYAGCLAAENYNYYPTGLYEHICRPDFIGRFLETFDLGLVLDLAHASVTAANLNLDLRSYLLELPLERVVEVHLSRPHLHPIVAVDAHAAPLDEDFDLLSFVLAELSGPAIVAIEHYRDLDTVLSLYRRLRELLGDFDLRPEAAVGGQGA
ncbi:MAG: DUF692 family protein [Proteobacteria bacterium]|nr:DUF692 family protein [Pseudomonadota bacterium]